MSSWHDPLWTTADVAAFFERSCADNLRLADARLWSARPSARQAPAISRVGRVCLLDRVTRPVA
jgi:hypothetical protein